jgi:hypothetical protein
MLRSYRLCYLTDTMREFRRRRDPQRTDIAPSLMTYDLCCQYFKNMHALQAPENT